MTRRAGTLLTLFLMQISAIDTAAQAIIRKVGDFAYNQFVNFTAAHIQYKGKNNLVSYVDIESEKMLREELGRLIAGVGFIGEEGSDTPSENGYEWIIDPIDGTTNFTHGVPFWSISVALMHERRPVLGYVYEVCHRELFSAIAGEGARLNGEPIRVSEANDLGKALLATGFPYTDFSFLQDYLSLLTDFMRASHGMRRFGSAALDLAYVASGRFDGYFEYGLNAWDVAAGVLLVREAGGMATTFTGEGDCIFNRQICVGTPEVHTQMMQVIENRLGGKLD